MGLANGDDIVLAPEDFHLSDTDKLVAFVEIREMEDKEIIVVVLVDLRSLRGTSAVLDVQGVEIVLF